MRSRAASVACALTLFLPILAAQSQYRAALPGYRYAFPRDHFNHPDFQTEWWYYTGNLRAADGHRFGFELTFFRQGVERGAAKAKVWDVRDLYMAHLALSDLDGGAFYHDERVNRAGPGIAGASEADRRIWNGNWSIDWETTGAREVVLTGCIGASRLRPSKSACATGDDQKLRAVGQRFELEFSLHPEKLPIVHGENGVSQKAAGVGRASHYVSLTRLDTKGRIQLGGKGFEVAGLTWMDHEFFTHQLEGDQVGWDWFSLQMEDKTELMLFRIRRKDGSVDPYSAGTFVDANGMQTHLRAEEFALQPLGESWKSAATHANYPIQWRISVPRLRIELEARASLTSQEITGTSKLSPNYWEGAITLSGRRGAASLGGVGYLEMTGYDRAFEMVE